MNSNQKKFIYDFSLLIFQWSLVYLLVLFFLEDLKPFLVSSRFSPHWIIVVVVLSAGFLMKFAKQGKKEIKLVSPKKNKFDLMIIKVISATVAFLWFFFLKLSFGWFVSLFLSVIIYFFLKRITNEFYFKN